MRRTTQLGSSRSTRVLGRCECKYQVNRCQTDCPWKPLYIFRSTAGSPLIGINGERKRFTAACHWCQVMAHESFENLAVARLMNERFINIKVDRQKRPDLDDIYQKVVPMMGQGGGWPLTVFMTPQEESFFGGTYVSPEARLRAQELLERCTA